MKQTLRTIMHTTTITTRELAECAGLSVTDVFVVEAGGYTSREKAYQVVTAFNLLSGLRIRVEDLAIHWREEIR